MLALSRRLGEAVTIGPNIRVVIIQIKGGTVRLGIDAPRTVAVHRDEVFSRVMDQNRLAAAAQTGGGYELPVQKPKGKRRVQVRINGPAAPQMKGPLTDDH